MFPKLDLSLKDSVLTYIFVVPGFRKEDLELKINGSQLLLNGTRIEDENTVKQYSGIPPDFSSIFHIPKGVNIMKDSVELKHGILNVPFKCKSSQEITIK